MQEEQLSGHASQAPLKLKNLSGQLSWQMLLYRTPVKQLKQVEDELMHVLQGSKHDTHSAIRISIKRPSAQSVTHSLFKL